MNADAVRHVQNQLARKNCAIIHRDDLFGSSFSEIWDEADAFMDSFAASPQAQEFEQTFQRGIKEAFELDKREADELAAADQELAQLKEGGSWKEFNWVPFGRRTLAGLFSQKRGQQAQRLLAKRKSIQKRYAEERKKRGDVFKPYLFTIKHLANRSPKYSDPPMLLSTTQPILDIADAYFGEKAKARVPTIWRVSPLSAGFEEFRRMGSQRWHRDQTDVNILKLFIYYSDVDKSSGALEYVPDSLPEASRWSDKIPLTDETGYPPEGLVESLVPKEEIIDCSGPRGTLVFADTAGLHRGGYALRRPRVTSQMTFLRQNPKLPQTPLLKGTKTERPLTLEQVFAFS